MTEMIKPIETFYNGYRFRSRLEARWAVFFDALGVQYEYEPEGFEMDSGERYLPDFYLSTEEMYVEVKPERRGAAEEIYKALQFVKRGGIERLLILPDIPFSDDCNIWWFPCFFYHPLRWEPVGEYVFFGGHEGQPWIVTNFWLGRQKELRSPYLDYTGKYSFTFETAINSKTLENRYPCPFGVSESFDNDFIKNAFIKAKTARFEYGQTPT